MLLSPKKATFELLIEVIFCYNSVKYEANFVILFLLSLEMISALNLYIKLKLIYKEFLTAT